MTELDDLETPELLGREVREWAPYDDLDLFFTRLYRCEPRVQRRHARRHAPVPEAPSNACGCRCVAG